MLKTTALAFFLLLPAAACDSDTSQPPGPIDSSDRSDLPIPTPGEECRSACKNLLAECEAGAVSLALDNCKQECKAQAFSAEEVTCLASRDCSEATDSCLGDL